MRQCIQKNCPKDRFKTDAKKQCVSGKIEWIYKLIEYTLKKFKISTTTALGLVELQKIKDRIDFISNHIVDVEMANLIPKCEACIKAFDLESFIEAIEHMESSYKKQEKLISSDEKYNRFIDWIQGEVIDPQ